MSKYKQLSLAHQPLLWVFLIIYTKFETNQL